jgi:hypothetical protein
MAGGGGAVDATGPQLVNMFTPEFCLRIGDNLVKSFRTEVPEHLDRWIQDRAQRGGHDVADALEVDDVHV